MLRYFYQLGYFWVSGHFPDLGLGVVLWLAFHGNDWVPIEIHKYQAIFALKVYIGWLVFTIQIPRPITENSVECFLHSGVFRHPEFMYKSKLWVCFSFKEWGIAARCRVIKTRMLQFILAIDVPSCRFEWKNIIARTISFRPWVWQRWGFRVPL